MKAVHVLVQHFPCQVAVLEDPSLARKPLVIGGNPWEKGVVYDCSPEAVEDGIHPGMPLRQAEQLSPRAIFLPFEEKKYQEVHRALLTAVAPFSPVVETLELGELCFEASGLKRLYGPDQKLARTVAGAIETTINLLPQIGIASNKFVAALAARFASPGKPRIITREEERAFLAPLPIEFLPANDLTKRFLCLLGIATLGQVVAMPKAALVKQFGAEGALIHDLVLGYDDRPISPTPEEPSLRSEVSFEEPVADLARLASHANRVAFDLTGLLRRDGRKCQGIALELTLEDGQILNTGTHLKEATCNPQKIARRLAVLLVSLDYTAAVTGLAIHLFPLHPFHEGSKQLELFDYLRKAKQEAVTYVVQRINERLGGDAVTSASKIGPPSPILVDVSPTAVGKPWFVKRNGRWVLVEAVTEHWRVEDDWRNGGSSRDYYQVVLIDGKIIVLCYQRPDKKWYLDISAKPLPCPVTLSSTATATTPS